MCQALCHQPACDFRSISRPILGRGRLPPVQTDDDVLRLAGRLDEMWRLVLRSVLIVEGALLLATLIVPVLGIDRDPEDPPSARSTRLVAGLSFYLTTRFGDFGNTDSHPYSVPGGVWLTRITLVLLLIALVVAVVATVRLSFERISRSTLIVARVAGAILIASPILMAAAQHWLSNRTLATPVQPGLLVPMLAGIWLLSIAAARSRLD